jgi:phosphoribosyl 1,2-cyclic phosphodiesterase
MKVRALASGSSGNCYLVQAGGYSLLIDCGLTASTLHKFLIAEGVEVGELGGIFLTHDHHDHLSGAGSVSRKWGVPVYANKPTLDAAQHRWEKMLKLEELRRGVPFPKESHNYNVKKLPTGGSVWVGPIEIQSFPVSHDAAETVCYTFRADGTQAVILTDLGCATEPIYKPLAASDLIVLEANHDSQQLWNSGYPYSLKKRVSGERGHLANEQSAAILRRCLEESGTHHAVWLAHLSKENNSPQQAVDSITAALNQAGINDFPLQVAGRDKPSLSYESAQASSPAQVYFQTRMLF